jgi:hypothetical protein
MTARVLQRAVTFVRVAFFWSMDRQTGQRVGDLLSFDSDVWRFCGRFGGMLFVIGTHRGGVRWIC